MGQYRKPGKSSARQAPGHVAGPAVAFALLSLVLVAGFGWAGLLDGPEVWVASAYHGAGLSDLAPVADVWLWIAIGLASSGLAWAVLDSPQLWRRVVLGVTALVLAAAWSPVLALLGLLFPVTPVLLAMFWAWFCATVYAHQHRMPCEGPAPAPPSAKPAAKRPAGRARKKPKTPVDHGQGGLS